jgi:amphi-Trp domain-containing protein
MKDTFKYQSATDQPELAGYLRALAEAVERGEILLADSGRSFSLNPRGLINLTLKARRKDGRSRVNMDIIWAEEAPQTPLLDDLEAGAPEWL